MLGEPTVCPTCGSKKVRVKDGRLQCSACFYDQLLKTARKDRKSQQSRLNVNPHSPLITPETKNTIGLSNVNQVWDERESSCESSCESSHDQPHIVKYELDDLRVINVMKALKSAHHEREIARITKISQSTVHRIIKFLLYLGKICFASKSERKSYCQAYKIIEDLPKSESSLIGDDERKRAVSCKGHHQKWTFALIHEAENLKRAKAVPCINTNSGMKNNKQKYFFRKSGNTIKLTTKSVIVMVKKHLIEIDSIDNLNAKYITWAREEAEKFCAEHNIKINTIPKKYQDNDFDILCAEPLAKLLREHGTFTVNADGVRYQVNPSAPGIEAHEDDARLILHRIHNTPEFEKALMERMVSEEERRMSAERTSTERMIAIEQRIIQLESSLKLSERLDKIEQASAVKETNPTGLYG